MINIKERIGQIHRVPNVYHPALSISLNTTYRKYSHNVRHIIPYSGTYRSNRLNRCYTSIESNMINMYDKLNRWVFLVCYAYPALSISLNTTYRKYSHNVRHIIPYSGTYRSNRLNRCYTSIESNMINMYDKLNRWVF